MTDTQQAPAHALLTDGATDRIRRACPAGLFGHGGGPAVGLEARVRLAPRHAFDPYLCRLR